MISDIFEKAEKATEQYLVSDWGIRCGARKPRQGELHQSTNYHQYFETEFQRKGDFGFELGFEVVAYPFFTKEEGDEQKGPFVDAFRMYLFGSNPNSSLARSARVINKRFKGNALSCIEGTNQELVTRPMYPEEIKKYNEIWQARLETFPKFGFSKVWRSKKFIQKGLNDLIQDALERNERDWKEFKEGKLSS